VFATEARGLTVIIELRRYNRSKKLQNCDVISGFVVIDASLYPIFFACIVIAGQTFGHHSVVIRIRFVVITDVVINDFYCIYLCLVPTKRLLASVDEWLALLRYQLWGLDSVG